MAEQTSRDFLKDFSEKLQARKAQQDKTASALKPVAVEYAKRQGESQKQYDQRVKREEQFNRHITSQPAYQKQQAQAQSGFTPSGAPKPSFLKGSPAGSEMIETMTPDQKAFVESLLPVIAERLTPLLNQLGTSPRTEMSSQIEQMFGHMNNPILQGLMNQGYRQNAQVLFPSQLAQQGSNDTLNALLGGLAQQYSPDIANYGYDIASEYLPRLAQGAGNLGRAGMNQAQQYGEAIMGIPQLLREGGKSFGESFQNPELYGGIPAGLSNLLGKLGSYLPQRNVQP
jgi:hypothetical protein